LSRYRSSGRQNVTLATVPAVAAVLILAGCSGSADIAASQPSVTFATDASVTPGMPGMSAMLAPSSVAQSSAVPATPPPQGSNAIAINDFAFAPATLTIPAGTTVTWTNSDEEPHTVAAEDGSFHSPGMGSGATYSFTFSDAGSYDYVCSIHPFMHGTVVVTK
jgi:plastocyanin